MIPPADETGPSSCRQPSGQTPDTDIDTAAAAGSLQSTHEYRVACPSFLRQRSPLAGGAASVPLVTQLSRERALSGWRGAGGGPPKPPQPFHVDVAARR